MSGPDRKKNAAKTTETTGHEWDGIKELDNPLPRWWLIVFYICIVFAIGYWFVMPAWPGLTGYTKGTMGYSDRVQVDKDLKQLAVQRGALGKKLLTADLASIEADPELQSYALAAGQAAFGDNCATCHGSGGAGAPGFPNLRDDVWLWGGKLEDIHRTLQHGVRAKDEETRVSAMPAFGRDGLLKPEEINDLTAYVTALSRRPANAAAVRRAAPIYATQCAACHGPNGKGNQAVGAPDLTDGDWLYGGSAEAIHTQIWEGRGGVMPAWKGRFPEETIKALAVYVHANAGGR